MTNSDIETLLAKRNSQSIWLRKTRHLMQLRRFLVEIEDKPSYELLDEFEALSEKFLQEQRRQLVPINERWQDE